MNEDSLSHAGVRARSLGWFASVVVLSVSGAVAAAEPPSVEPVAVELANPVVEAEPPIVEPAAAESANPVVGASTSSERDADVGHDVADLLRSVEEFRTRIDLLEFEIREHERVTEDADRLFRELEDVLWQHLGRVHAALDRGAADIVDQQAALDKLYAERVRLFALLSPERRARLGGGGPTGRAALALELTYLRTSLFAQLRVLQRGLLPQIGGNVSAAPVRTMTMLLEVLLAVLVFLGWRRWSNQGLVSARTALLNVRPQPRTNVLLARALWYLNRVNGPLAWLILVFVLSRLLMPRGFEKIFGLVYTTLFWVLVALFAVQLIDALATRDGGGLRAGARELRLRSLRLLAAGLVVMGLGLDLIGSYVGQGAVYAWGVRIGQFLSAPIVLVLIHWWKAAIFACLQAQSDHSELARRLASVSADPWSYPAVVLGAGYLAWGIAFRWMVRLLSRHETGRRALALMVRRQMESEVEASGEGVEPAGPAPKAEAMLEVRGPLIESVAREQLDALSAFHATGRGGGTVVVAERGGGKTTFLERLAEPFGDAMRIVDCPPGGYDAFEAALATELGLAATHDVGERLPEAIESGGIRILGVDNAHRLARPFMGGQKGLDRLIALDARLEETVSWTLMMDQGAWRYILLGRGERALFQEMHTLPPWDEVQLRELVERRSAGAGIEPDYTDFVLPIQLDTGEHESVEERNRLGYARILWETADGNPEVAVRLFAHSLRSARGRRMVVDLPQTPFSASLRDATVGTLLVLRVVLQCEIASVEDIARSLRVSADRALSSARFCLQNEWLEEIDGGLRLSWDWYPTVTRLLERKNLLPR